LGAGRDSANEQAEQRLFLGSLRWKAQAAEAAQAFARQIRDASSGESE